MCNPVAAMAAAQLAITVVSTVSSYDDQAEAAKRQQQMVQDGIEKDRIATSQMYEQINQSSQDEQAQLHTQMLVDKAKLHAINGESGLSGATYDRMDQEVANNASTDMATLEKNREWKAQNANSQSQARGTQANVQSAGIRQPSALGAGLQIAGAGVKAYQQINPQKADNNAR